MLIIISRRVYFMLSAVSTPKLAIVWGERISWIVMLLSPDKSCYFMSIDTAIKRALLKTVLRMKCNLDEY